MSFTLRQVEVKSFSEFIEQTENADPFADLVLFRGQPVQGNLLPSVSRRHPKRDTSHAERAVIEQFRLLGASLLPAGEQNDLDLLILAQHFGLKTRLLDWTTNPLAALWFACSDSKQGDTYVYILEAEKLVDKTVYGKDPFSPSRTRVIQPRHNNARIVAQNGWFTLHRHSKSAGQFVPLEKNSDTRDKLLEIKIPDEHRIFMLNSLERHGVTSKTVYPDMAGLCQYLNWKYFY